MKTTLVTIKILGGGEGFDPVQKMKGKNNNGH